MEIVALFKRLSYTFLIIGLIIGLNIFPAYISYRDHEKGSEEVLALAIVGFILYVLSGISLKVVGDNQKDPNIPIAIAIKISVVLFYVTKICLNIVGLATASENLVQVYVVNIITCLVVLLIQLPVLFVMRILRNKIKAAGLLQDDIKPTGDPIV